MTTPNGKAYVLHRLSDAPDLNALRRVWESLGREYQQDADVVAFKDLLKEGMS